jgi:hypothetical protein
MSEAMEEIGYVQWSREEQIKKLDDMMKVLKITEKKPSVRIRLKMNGGVYKYGLELAKDLIKNNKATLER